MTCSQEEFPPQYQSDLEGLAGEPDKKWVKYDGHDGGAPLGLHDETLFDQNETELGGELIDPATGRKIDNSTDRVIESYIHVDPVKIYYEEDDDLLQAVTGEDGTPDFELYFHIMSQRAEQEDKYSSDSQIQ